MPAAQHACDLHETMTYWLPYHARRGFVHSGALSRMRRVVHDMVAGKPVKIAVIGGSITADSANNKAENWWAMGHRARLVGPPLARAACSTRSGMLALGKEHMHRACGELMLGTP